jgi:putative selenate reductase
MVEVSGKHQIVHIDRSCNECGNCAVFCPWAGKPYKEKFTIFSCEEDFANSENPGFLKTGENSYKLRLEDKSVIDWSKGAPGIPETWTVMIDVIEEKYGYLELIPKQSPRGFR